MNGKKQAELLAPAGSYESMKAAFAAGADAVYIGGSRFGARAYAQNLEEDQMCRAIDYAHLHGRKIYMTVNTLFKEQELKELYAYLLPYVERGLDAVIVQDLGAMALIRNRFPDLAVHASTQMTITGAYGARLLKELGAVRIVTARELSLEEIRRIHSQVDIEIESFVHGALCYCYSGQCLMSSLIGGRSGNRGRCAQPCRLPYEVKRKGQTVNPKSRRMMLNLKDLCTLDQLPDILEAGVYSLKIEGRMKSPRYTAGVVSIYRKYLDYCLDQGRKGYRVSDEDRKLLLDLFDRGGFTEGYGRQHNGRDMVALKEKPAFREGNQEYFDYLDKTYVNCSLKEPVRGRIRLEAGKEAELTFSALSDSRPVSVTVYGMTVQEAASQPVTEEKIRKQLEKTGDTPFYVQDLEIRIEGNVFLPVQAINQLRRDGLAALEEEILSGKRRLSEGMQGVLEQKVFEEPSNREIAGQKIFGEASMQESVAQGVFGEASMQEIAVQKIFGEIPEQESVARLRDGKKSTGGDKEHPEEGQDRLRFVVSIEEKEQLSPALNHPDVDEIYLDADGFPAECWKDTVNNCHKAGKMCLLLMPHIFRKKADEYFRAKLEMLIAAGFDGIVVRNLEECRWLKEKGNALLEQPGFLRVGDASLYGWNHMADKMMGELGIERLTMPVELNARELREKGCRGQELLVYGALPMMVSAQCIKKTALDCDGIREVLGLKDLTGKEMAVKNHCRFCYNTIYNASPLSLLGREDLAAELKPGAVRLQFTTESPREEEECIAAFADNFLHGKKEKLSLAEFTRGHIKRGVE